MEAEATLLDCDIALLDLGIVDLVDWRPSAGALLVGGLASCAALLVGGLASC